MKLEMWDTLRIWMLRANRADIDAVTFASSPHCIVTRIEVLSSFQALCEGIGLGRKFAVAAEQASLIWR